MHMSSTQMISFRDRWTKLNRHELKSNTTDSDMGAFWTKTKQTHYEDLSRHADQIKAPSKALPCHGFAQQRVPGIIHFGHVSDIIPAIVIHFGIFPAHTGWWFYARNRPFAGTNSFPSWTIQKGNRPLRPRILNPPWTVSCLQRSSMLRDIFFWFDQSRY